jgi:hypothetical protein
MKGALLEDSTDVLEVGFDEVEKGTSEGKYAFKTRLDIVSPEQPVDLEIRCYTGKSGISVQGDITVPNTKAVVQDDKSVLISGMDIDDAGDSFALVCLLPKNSFVAGVNDVLFEVKVLNVISDVKYEFIAISEKTFEKGKDDFYRENEVRMPQSSASKEEKFSYANALYLYIYKGEKSELFTNAFQDDVNKWDSFSENKVVKWVLQPDIALPFIGLAKDETFGLTIGRDEPDFTGIASMSDVEFDAKIKLVRLILRDGIEFVKKTDDNKVDAVTSAAKDLGFDEKLLPTVPQKYHSVILDSVSYAGMAEYAYIFDLKVISPESFLNLEVPPENPAEISTEMNVVADYIFKKKATIEIDPQEAFMNDEVRIPLEGFTTANLPDCEPGGVDKDTLCVGAYRKRQPGSQSEPVHDGIDIYAIEGTKVYPMYKEMTVESITCGVYGGLGINLVTTDGRVKLYYGHLKDVLVKAGDTVTWETPIATSGTTLGCFVDKCKAFTESCDTSCKSSCEDYCTKNAGTNVDMIVGLNANNEYRPVSAPIDKTKCLEYCDRNTVGGVLQGLSCAIPYKTAGHLHVQGSEKKIDATGKYTYERIDPYEKLKEIG